MRKLNGGVTTSHEQSGNKPHCPVLDPFSNVINKEEDHRARKNADHPADRIINCGILNEEPDQILLIRVESHDFGDGKESPVAYKRNDIKACGFIVMRWCEIARCYLQGSPHHINFVRGKVTRLGKAVPNPYHP